MVRISSGNPVVVPAPLAEEPRTPAPVAVPDVEVVPADLSESAEKSEKLGKAGASLLSGAAPVVAMPVGPAPAAAPAGALDEVPTVGDGASAARSAVKTQADGMKGVQDQLAGVNKQITDCNGQIRDMQAQISKWQTDIANLHVNIAQLMQLIAELQNDYVDVSRRLAAAGELKKALYEELKWVNSELQRWENNNPYGNSGMHSGFGFGMRHDQPPKYAAPAEGGIKKSGLVDADWGTTAASLTKAEEMLARTYPNTDGKMPSGTPPPDIDLSRPIELTAEQKTDIEGRMRAFAEAHRPQGDMRTDPKQMREALEKYKASIEGMVKEVDSEIKNLRGQLELIQKRIGQCKGKIKECEDQIKTLEARIEQGKKTVKALQEQLKNLQETRLRLQKQLGEMQKQMVDLQHQMVDAQQRMNTQLQKLQDVDAQNRQLAELMGDDLRGFRMGDLQNAQRKKGPISA